HRARIGRGGRDGSKDAARRRLAFERLAQVAVPGLEFLEQPDVLDRDHRLVGEGLEQLDLTFGETALRAGHVDRAKRAPVAEHRNDDHALEPLGARDVAQPRGDAWIAAHVWAMD